MSLEY